MMIDETLEAPIDAIDMYKSLSLEHRSSDREILDVFLERNIPVDSIRYAEMRDVRRGAVKSIDGSKYYFHIAPNADPHVMLADTAEKSGEVDRILRSCRLGVDLKKADKIDEDEDEEKAMEGASAELPPPSMKEDQAVAQNQAQVTDVHPGATTSQTPQSDGSAARWHGPAAMKADLDATLDMLKSTTARLMSSIPMAAPALESLEHRFMREVLNKSVGEISVGARLSPVQRAQFTRWSAQELRKSIDALEKRVRRG